jgi:hypothetical protein
MFYRTSGSMAAGSMSAFSYHRRIAMSVLRPRNRLVNFRLSEDEFERLKGSCEAFGARSISDFARTSVLDRLDQNPASSPSTGVVLNLGDKVAELEMRVGQILNLLEATGTATVSDHSMYDSARGDRQTSESGAAKTAETVPSAVSFDW